MGHQARRSGAGSRHTDIYSRPRAVPATQPVARDTSPANLPPNRRAYNDPRRGSDGERERFAGILEVEAPGSGLTFRVWSTSLPLLGETSIVVPP
jgi:hypothetical protein